MAKRQPAQQEVAQRCADAYLDLAQFLEKQAQQLRQTAKHYRSGECVTGYTGLPADACAEVRHPAQRAIDGLSCYDIRARVEALQAALKG